MSYILNDNEPSYNYINSFSSSVVSHSNNPRSLIKSKEGKTLLTSFFDFSEDEITNQINQNDIINTSEDVIESPNNNKNNNSNTNNQERTKLSFILNK